MASRARDILLRLTGDPSGAKGALDEVKADLNRFDRIQAEARADIEIAGAKAKLERLQNQLVRLSRQEATPAVQIKAASTVRAIEKIEADLKRLDGKKAEVTITEKTRSSDTGPGDGGGRGSGIGAGALGGAAARAGVVGVAVGGTALGVKKFADAAVEAEKSSARLRAQLKALGIDFDSNAKKIDVQIQKVSNLSGLDDEDLADSFTNIVRVTGDVEKSLNLVGLAADFARAKNIDVAKAGEIVAKVAGGNTGVLSRYGIQIDKGASSTEALGELQKRFAGQAKAYGDTTAGALDRAGVAAENASESIGDSLRPALTAAADAFVDFIQFVRDGFPEVKRVVGDVVDAVRGFFKDNEDDIDSVRKAFENVGKVVKFVFEEVILPIIRNTIETVSGILRGFARAVRGVVRIITGILTGDFGKAWDGVKDVFSGGVTAIISVLDGFQKSVRGIGRRIGNAFKAGLTGALDGIKSIALDVVNGMIDVVNQGINAINKISPFGDVGKIKPITGNHPGDASQKRTGAPNRSPGGFKLPASARSGFSLTPAFAGAGSGPSSSGGDVTVILPPPPEGGVPDARWAATQIGRELERRGRG